ncbi:MAG: GNAT family N-acetyltransferase [Flavobacteriales bacterium]
MNIFWGKDLMTQVLIRFNWIYFDSYEFNRLYACVCTKNTPSRRVLEKSGYQFR